MSADLKKSTRKLIQVRNWCGVSENSRDPSLSIIVIENCMENHFMVQINRLKNG